MSSDINTCNYTFQCIYILKAQHGYIKHNPHILQHTTHNGNTLRTKPWPFRSSCWAYQKNLSSTTSQPTENINGISIYIYPFNKAQLGASSVLIFHHLPGVPTLKRENLRVLELQPWNFSTSSSLVIKKKTAASSRAFTFSWGSVVFKAWAWWSRTYDLSISFIRRWVPFTKRVLHRQPGTGWSQNGNKTTQNSYTRDIEGLYKDYTRTIIPVNQKNPRYWILVSQKPV